MVGYLVRMQVDSGMEALGVCARLLIQFGVQLRVWTGPLSSRWSNHSGGKKVIDPFATLDKGKSG